MPLTVSDWTALCFFVAAWAAYHVAIQRSTRAGQTLNGMMNAHRIRWMMEMARRENRIVDSSIMSALQSGAAFFTSTSLIAIGGAAALLRAGDDVPRIFGDLPFLSVGSRGAWEFKCLGLLVIFGYAFFKFAWSYRLFNYAAILMGATPAGKDADPTELRKGALRAARMNIVAGRHFTRGQRALLFALAYTGWFAGPYVFLATTVATLIVMGLRQFRSDAREAAGDVSDRPERV